MTYLTFEFSIPDDLQEIFIAELIDLDFYGFEQFDDKLVAYVDQVRFNDAHREIIEQMVANYPGAGYRETNPVEEQNWNRAWEETIRPQEIGTFLVKPTWSDAEPTDKQVLLEIDPKMAFGTGYHATTRLMLRQLSKIKVKGKEVMDAGTGTGILAIATVKLGAKKAIGFDTDPWSRENAAENALINKVAGQVEIRYGAIEQIKPGERFDVTLANINRNVILEIISFLVHHTKAGGTICISGLLDTDEEIVRDKLSREPVDITDFQQEEEWILLECTKHEPQIT